MSAPTNRIILVDPSDATRDVLAKRLRAQGYIVDEAADPATGADMALCAPPSAVVADLWMPSISGVQLCRLLRSEPATAGVAIILCGDVDEPRNRFWAERAGADAYVQKRRTADLVRALRRVAKVPDPDDSFFFQMAGTLDIRDRIARHLDAALFDSVMAAEVRALAVCGAFDQLFDAFVQFLSQVTNYRWVAISIGPERLAIHHRPNAAEMVEAEARVALKVSSEASLIRIEDEDAVEAPLTAPAIVRAIPFGNEQIGQIAFSPRSAADADSAATLVSLIARELGGALRMASLIEESQRLAATDPLTGLMNRRAFGKAIGFELARTRRHGYALSLIMLDIDHFKLINDKRGHAAGDLVIAALGKLLRSGGLLRVTDISARWGGEEFVVAYLSTPREGAVVAAERLRSAIESLVVADERGVPIPITASVGLAELRTGENLEAFVDRADRAMYASKAAGRNRVTTSGGDLPLASPALESSDTFRAAESDDEADAEVRRAS